MTKNRFFYPQNRFSAKINPVFELSAFDLYRVPSLARIGDKKFSSFPRGDPREIEKFDLPLGGALINPRGQF